MSILQKLFKKCRQKIDRNMLFFLLSEASMIDIVSTLRICIYIRDISFGLGKRKMGRWCYEWIAIYHPTIFIRIIPHIPYYGRWDDLLYINHPNFEHLIFQFIQTQLHIDKWNMMIGQPISFCAKWLPSEGKTFHKTYPDKFQRLLNTLNMTPKEYRQQLKLLREYANIPEQLICKKEWNKVNYNLIPKQSLQKHTNTFLKFDFDRFIQFDKKIFSMKSERFENLTDIIDTLRYFFINQIIESLSV